VQLRSREVRIGEDVTEQLEYGPGKVFVFRHIYPRYTCACSKDSVTTAATVASPPKGGLPRLLAYVVVNKFSDHLPLYEQQDTFAGHGIFPARSTLCGWLA
jgi:transposase